MTRIRKQLNKLLLLVLTCALLSGSLALAAGSCGIRVVLRNSADEPVPQIDVELHQVAVYQNGAHTLTPEFARLSVSAQALFADPGTDHAELVYQYVHAQDLPGLVKSTSDAGIVEFSGLEEGIYLVFEHGEQAVAFEPYLVVLPSVINGTPAHQVISHPKLSETDTHTLMVVKLWDDKDNAAGKRPSDLEITVLRDGLPFRKVTLNESNLWQHTFHMLPNSGTYTVVEESIPHYSGEFFPVMEGYVIVNTYTGSSGGGGGGGSDPEPTHVSVTKIWDDDDNAAGKRPDSVIVQLIEDGTIIKTAALREAGNWKHTFHGLDPDKSYTVQEIAVPGYTATYWGNASTGIRITNTYTGETDPGTPPAPIVPTPTLIDIPVRIDWVDENNAYLTRPDEVVVHLLTNGSMMAALQIRSDNTIDHPAVTAPIYSDAEAAIDSPSGTLEIPLTHGSSGNSWYGIFKSVPADLSYSVWQNAVADYTTTYSGSAAEGFVVTNVYTPGTTDPGIPPEPTSPEEPAPPVVAPELDETPDDPTALLPQTGAEVLPVYLLMAVGVLLVLLGLIDLYRGREEE